LTRTTCPTFRKASTNKAARWLLKRSAFSTGYISYLKRQKPGEHEPGYDINVDHPLNDELPE